MLIIGDPGIYRDKEHSYINVRTKEGRIYSDKELLNLPEISKEHSYYTEWMYRKRSFLRFKKYLSEKFKGKPAFILDVGCGNGWMSNNLYAAGHYVTAVDLNITELEQAERTFGSNERLTWIYADILNQTFTDTRFDIILFAASVQYFPDIANLTKSLCPFLTACGEIHFIDSVFYTEDALAPAIRRSLKYYRQLGFPEMAKYYFHHTRKKLELSGYKKMQQSYLQKIFSKKSTLEWWRYVCPESK